MLRLPRFYMLALARRLNQLVLRAAAEEAEEAEKPEVEHEGDV